MARLEDLTRGAQVLGILPGVRVAVVDAKWHGTSVLEVTYKDPSGRLGNELLFRDTRRVEALAMAAVIESERHSGREPRDVSADRWGYDVESRIPGTGKLRSIEVKGRAAGEDVVTVTKNEILTALNQPEDFILAIVVVDGDSVVPKYVRRPFQREPDFNVTSVNFKLRDVLARGEDPA